MIIFTSTLVFFLLSFIMIAMNHMFNTTGGKVSVIMSLSDLLIYGTHSICFVRICVCVCVSVYITFIYFGDDICYRSLFFPYFYYICNEPCVQHYRMYEPYSSPDESYTHGFTFLLCLCAFLCLFVCICVCFEYVFVCLVYMCVV